MRTEHWLTINSKGGARLTKSQPGLSWNEISVKLELNLPNELFNRPRLEAKIDIPKEAAGPDVITSEVIDNATEAIKKATGLTFSINVVKEELDEEERID